MARPDQLCPWAAWREQYVGILGPWPLLWCRTCSATVRTSIGDRLFERVAGPEGPRRRDRIHGAEGPRWFEEARRSGRSTGTRRCSSAASGRCCSSPCTRWRWPGSLDHSGFEGDPWGRLQRTSYFLAVTTFGTAADAEQMVAAIRAVHERVVGTAPDGRAYAASDPHLLRWVHVAEIDSFLAAHQRYGAAPLDQEGRDRYVAETARVAEALGVPDPPAQRGRPARPAGRLPPGAGGHPGRPEDRAVPAAAPAAAAARPRAVRRPGGLRGGADAAVGPPPAAAAAPAGDRAGAGQDLRRRDDPDDPLGDARAALRKARAAPASPATTVTP